MKSIAQVDMLNQWKHDPVRHVSRIKECIIGTILVQSTHSAILKLLVLERLARLRPYSTAGATINGKVHIHLFKKRHDKKT